MSETKSCLIAKSCLTVCDPMNCSLPCSSVHGISQERILEQAAISFSKETKRDLYKYWK